MKSINITRISKAMAEHDQALKELDRAQQCNAPATRIQELKKQGASMRDEVNKRIQVLKDAIRAAEGQAKVRCVSYLDVIDTANHIERKLNILKKDLVGCGFTCDVHAQTFPSAYRFAPQSTQFTAQYTRAGWVITDIYRAKTRSRNNGISIWLTDQAKREIINLIERGRF